jgi:hypothetical protein
MSPVKDEDPVKSKISPSRLGVTGGDEGEKDRFEEGEWIPI